MLFAEQLGVEEFRERVKIYATDVDAEALAYARHATYTAREMGPVPEALRQKYFEQATGQPAFEQPARRSQAAPYLNVQAGVSYVPPTLPNVKFTAGYQFEEFFNVGKLGTNGQGVLSQTRGEVWAHGIFLRGQVDF